MKIAELDPEIDLKRLWETSVFDGILFRFHSKIFQLRSNIFSDYLNSPDKNLIYTIGGVIDEHL